MSEETECGPTPCKLAKLSCHDADDAGFSGGFSHLLAEEKISFAPDIADHASVKTPVAEMSFSNPFDTLPAELGYYICRYLSLIDRLHFERANASLTRLTAASWVDETVFCAASFGTREYACPCHANRAQKASAILSICSRIGPNLRTLVLSIRLPLRWNYDLTAIADECPNIVSIEFIPDAARGDELIPTVFGFHVFTKLKCLHFNGALAFFANDPSVLVRVPPSLEVFYGSIGENLTVTEFEAFFKSALALRDVELVDPSLRRSEVNRASLFPLIANCPYLKELCVNASDVSVDGIELLVDMRKVVIRGGPLELTDAQIITFCEKNKGIQVLDTSGECARLTSLAFDALARLEHLEVFSFSFPFMEEDEMEEILLELIANSGRSLRVLEAYRDDTPPLTHRTIEAMIGVCAKLRHLEFFVYDVDVVEAVSEVVKYVVGTAGFDATKEQLEICMWNDFNDEDDAADDDVSDFEALEVAVAQLASQLPVGASVRLRHSGV